MTKINSAGARLAIVLAFALAAACKGSDGATGPAGTNGADGSAGTNGTNGTNGNNGTNGTNGTNGINAASTGLNIAVVSTSIDATSHQLSVRFTLKDDRGYGIDPNGVYSVNVPRTAPSASNPFALRFSVSNFTVTNGVVSAYNVLTTSGTPLQPTAFNPWATPTPQGTLVENGTGAGDFTYTFPASAAVDPASTLTHTVWIQAMRQTNLDNVQDPTTWKATNFEYDFVPAGGTPAKREVVLTANCSKCHNAFKPQGTVASAFHGGGRVEATYCDVCHNPGRVSNPAADAKVFVHRIHNAEMLQSANVFHGIADVTYPQDIRNCAMCHGGAAQGDQYKTQPTRAACGSCHDYVDFTGTAVAPVCTVPVTRDANDKPIPCIHKAGAQADDTGCATCHTPALIASGHLPVADPDAGNIFLPQTSGTATAGYQGGTSQACSSGTPCVCTLAAPCANPTSFAIVNTTQKTGTVLTGITACGTGHQPSPYAACTCTSGNPCFGAGNNNTNAASLSAAGAVPDGAKQVTYVLKTDSSGKAAGVSLNAAGAPVIQFKLQLDKADVVFNKWGSGKTELIDNFVGSPSVYFAFAVPQDGHAGTADAPLPADFNASASAYIKGVWSAGTTTGSATAGVSNGVACTVAAPCDCTVNPCYAAGKDHMYGPDANGFYTIVLASQALPTARGGMLTGGVGYTYGLTSTPPLTQTNVPGYPYTASNKQGGVVVSAPDVWQTASSGALLTSGTSTTGTQGATKCTSAAPCTCSVGTPCNVAFTARRAIVETARCQSCHVQLGVAPTFHAGQRNDGPTCSFCHNPNRTSSGWSANGKDFIHAIHAGDQRAVPFTWHSTATESFADVTFPGQLNHCEACHVPGGYDFSVNAAAVPNLLASTVATGKYNGDDPAASIAFSPWIQAKTDATFTDNTLDYGFGFATSAVKVSDGRTVTSGTQDVVDNTGTKTTNTCSVGSPCVCTPDKACTVKASCTLSAPCEADATTLVTSPIMSACAACHDDPAARAHMVGNGGTWYQPRSVAANNVEQCLICHGSQPGAVAPIAQMHK